MEIHIIYKNANFRFYGLGKDGKKWNAYNDCKIIKASKEPAIKENKTFNIDFDIKNKNLYVVYATYERGDENGKETGICEILIPVETKEEAELFKEKILNIPEKEKLLIWNNQKIELPWIHFNYKLENINIKNIPIVEHECSTI